MTSFLLSDSHSVFKSKNTASQTYLYYRYPVVKVGDVQCYRASSLDPRQAAKSIGKTRITLSKGDTQLKHQVDTAVFNKIPKLNKKVWEQPSGEFSNTATAPAAETVCNSVHYLDSHKAHKVPRPTKKKRKKKRKKKEKKRAMWVGICGVMCGSGLMAMCVTNNLRKPFNCGHNMQPCN